MFPAYVVAILGAANVSAGSDKGGCVPLSLPRSREGKPFQRDSLTRPYEDRWGRCIGVTR